MRNKKSGSTETARLLDSLQACYSLPLKHHTRLNQVAIFNVSWFREALVSRQQCELSPSETTLVS